MTSHLRILHLEDDPVDAEFIAAILEKDGLVCEVSRVDTRDSFMSQMESGTFDIILADYSLPVFDGLSALESAKTRCPDVPFIFISGKGAYIASDSRSTWGK